MRAHSHTDRLSTHAAGILSVRVSDAPDDPAWDDFLERASSGHYAQTSGWGRARASIGWQPIRGVISEDGRVVAGAQMVTRPLPAGGRIGFVRRGPVVEESRPDLARIVFDQMLAMGKQRGVQYLVVQPPPGGDWMSEELKALGFRYGAFDIDMTATLLVDLRPDLDELPALTSKSFRRHIRKAEKRGVTVRQGFEADLTIFNRLKDLHSARLGYPRRSERYYSELWRSLAPRGHIALFIAEFEGTPISAQLLMPFRDTCHFVEIPWSGEHRNLGANELLDWESLKWAKSRGYQFADLEGIDALVAEAVLEGREVPTDFSGLASHYKLKLGGQVVVDPPSFDYVYNPALRSVYRCIPNKLMRSEATGRLLFRFRETGS